MPTRIAFPNRPLIEAGQMRERIEIQINQPVADSGGGTLDNWVTVAKLWASVRPLQLASSRSATSTEPYRQDQLQPQQVTEFVCRYAGSLDITPAQMRVYHKGRSYIIRSVVNVAARNHEMNIIGQDVLFNQSIDE